MSPKTTKKEETRDLNTQDLINSDDSIENIRSDLFEETDTKYVQDDWDNWFPWEEGYF